MSKPSETAFPPQQQSMQPGREHEMHPAPESKQRYYHGSDKLHDKVALITGGDSGIGRAVTIAFAKEGADAAVVYLNEHKDATETKRLVEEAGRQCLLLPGDVGSSEFCAEAVAKTVQALGRLDVLVNNSAEQHVQERVEDISDEQLLATFRTNIFGMFYMTRAALPHLKPGSAIINTTSVTA